jgi:NitT/TauT family transport system ATP-binding protein/nitrate/nitrite transport system substrate-binding protein
MSSSEKTALTIGFVPLTDSAPLVVAKALGFFEDEGINVTLQKQNSWATLRDKLHAGVLDAAQMLAPMPLASSLGLGCYPCKIVTPFVLSLNGNAITISNALYEDILRLNALSEIELPLDSRYLRAVIQSRKVQEKEKLKFANVFPYSCHHYQLLDWLRRGGISESDVQILTVPPINMVSFLESGEIDGFCVGGPWNAKAVRSGIGLTGLTSYDIWENMPEKVLGVSEAFLETHPQTVRAICQALHRACCWLESTPNRFEAARLLSQTQFLDAPLDVIAPSLIGSCLTHQSLAPRKVEQYNQFYGQGLEVNRPFVASGRWLLDKMLQANQVSEQVCNSFKVEEVFREDVYTSLSA